jgi:hypothetical protein
MAKIKDIQLYKKAMAIVYSQYKKPSAYKSGYVVRLYKQLGGTYTEDFKPKKLKTWFKERWADIGEKDYPVYRPTIRVNKDTPLTIQEIDPQNLKEQIALKQQIKGKRNLPDFRRKSV